MDGPPEPEVARVHRSAHQLRCHVGCADASALAQEEIELATFARATAPGESQVSTCSGRKETSWVGVRPQREKNRGSDAQPPAARTVAGREMAEESSQ